MVSAGEKYATNSVLFQICVQMASVCKSLADNTADSKYRARFLKHAKTFESMGKVFRKMRDKDD